MWVDVCGQVKLGVGRFFVLCVCGCEIVVVDDGVYDRCYINVVISFSMLSYNNNVCDMSVNVCVILVVVVIFLVLSEGCVLFMFLYCVVLLS